MLEWLVNDPIGFSLFSFIRNLVYLIVVLWLCLFLMRLVFNTMDKSLGINFRDHVWEKINDDSVAVALYFGLRVFGVLVLVGMVASAFIK